MRARNRSAIFLIILAIAAFILRWPLDDTMCNPKTWGGYNPKGEWKSYRPPHGEGKDFFSAVFTGGGGTPAIFAMLGGQRYLVANILWNYSDTLFHNGKTYEMVDPLDACVTLNPSFLEAWSTYGWHLAWNLSSEDPDIVRKALWFTSGRDVYIRALKANPDKVLPYFDLAWLYIQRERDYAAALPYLKAVVEPAIDDPLNPKNKYEFAPLTEKEEKTILSGSTERLNRWTVASEGNRLAYVYRKLGVVQYGASLKAKQSGDAIRAGELRNECRTNLQHAIRIYKMVGDPIKYPKNTISRENAKDVTAHLDDPKWLEEEWLEEYKLQQTYGLAEKGTEQ